jgi:hypothetical protein
MDNSWAPREKEKKKEKKIKKLVKLAYKEKNVVK